MKLKTRVWVLEERWTARIRAMEEKVAKQASRLQCLEKGHNWGCSAARNTTRGRGLVAAVAAIFGTPSQPQVQEISKGKLKAKRTCSRCGVKEEREFDLNTVVGRKAFEAFLRGE